MNFFGIFIHIFISLLSLMFIAPANAQIKDDVTYITEFTTLNENMAAASLIWALNVDTNDQSRALQALLSAKISGPMGAISARESIDFRVINNIDLTINATPKHLILTITSPKENFKDAIKHINQILRNTEINKNWLKRKNRAYEEISSSRLRTPELLETELTDYTLFTGNSPLLNESALKLEILRRPNQIIFNAKNYNFRNLADVLMDGLLSHDATLNNFPIKPHRKLPAGIIHSSDENSSETLIFIGTIKEFKTVREQAQTNILYKYMGYGPGSEMFRIIRQEKRASYDPRSHFTQIGKQLAFTGLSATVSSKNWHEVYDLILKIYNDTRAGINTEQGLQDSRDSMINNLVGNLRRRPEWLAQRYLELHPAKPPEQIIDIKLLSESFSVLPLELNNKANKILENPVKLISIIIGGKINPKMEIQHNMFCKLPPNKRLDYCLDKLTSG